MNNSLFDSLRNSRSSAEAVLESGSIRLSLSDLQSRVESLATNLRRIDAKRVAIYANNGVDFVTADLACQSAGLVAIPLPLFFSAEQIRHAIKSAGVDTVIADRDINEIIDDAVTAPSIGPLQTAVDRIYRLSPEQGVSLPDNTQKITFTSGTTGTPKGVCLSTKQGEFNVDWGLLFELEREIEKNAWEASAQILASRDFGKTTLIANFGVIYEWGERIQNEIESTLRVQTRYRLTEVFEPGIELHVGQDTTALGPAFSGLVRVSRGRIFRWELGVFAGLSERSPDHILKANIEFEF